MKYHPDYLNLYLSHYHLQDHQHNQILIMEFLCLAYLIIKIKNLWSL